MGSHGPLKYAIGMPGVSGKKIVGNSVSAMGQDWLAVRSISEAALYILLQNDYVFYITLVERKYASARI